ncbi:uncharacterized protein KGF55_004999 [Candida pseudojiufengensis]|uniref:uncharacterized protein n=1 Tax=Candida pseudojiufengensis TaxID=497109 RepID=UPI00222449FE|nr:uncharacterized protein KGF55_004999 [Candida pseudojiufengensis]KAI5959767.1 hypothetical protein KGF55_004999 [Candida pseudojiufengensis]
MENYNPAFLQQLNPFLRIHIPPTLKNNEITIKLVSQFNVNNVRNKQWDNCLIRNRLSTPKYLIEIDYDENLRIPSKNKIPNQHDLLSPFNQESDIFPNGILTHQWFEKYINEIPFAILYVCEISTEGAAEKVDALILRLKKLKTELEEIECKLVVLLIFQNNSIDESTIDKIKSELNFPKMGYLYQLVDTENTIDRDVEIVVNSILSNLWKISHDFYSNIEYRIKQRHKKYYTMPSTDAIDTSIELTPKFLEIRNLIKQAIMGEFINPSNLEPSIKLLEVAYQDLIGLLDSMYAINLSDHDNKLIAQIRTILDIIAFHIVRGYFAIEEPVKSLRKHKTHIINVVEILKENHEWISKQYEWLAELMDMIPYNMLNYLNTTAVSRSSNNNGISSTIFFGGIHTPEFDLISNPGLIYLKAFELNSESGKRIELLQKSIESLESIQSEAMNESSISGSDSLVSVISYINWLLGEEYFKIGDYKKSSDFLEMSYSSLGDGKWLSISEVILVKLLKCYSILDSKKLEFNTILKLSTFPHSFVFDDDKIANLCDNIFEFDGDKVEIDLLDSKLHELFVVDVLLIDKKKVNDSLNETTTTTVGDELLFQVSLKSKINLSTLKTLLPSGSDVYASLKQIDIPFTRLDKVSKNKGIKNISISHDPTKTKQDTNIIHVKGQELEQTFVGSANLTFDHIPMTLQHEQYITHSGTYGIEVVKLQIVIEIKNKERTKIIRSNKIELHNLASKKTNSNAFGNPINNFGYLKLGDSKIPKFIRLAESNRSIVVHPKIPSINIVPVNDIDCYIVGEKYTIPFSINFDNDDVKSNQKVALTVGVKNKGYSVGKNNAGEEVTLSWNDLKDDEPLKLSSIAEDKLADLNIFSRQYGLDLLNLQFSLILYDDDDDSWNDQKGGIEPESHSYMIQTVEVPILQKPFDSQYFTLPKYDESLKFPQYNEGEKSPILKREWQLILKTTDLLSSFNLNHLNLNARITNVEFNIISRNPDVTIQLLGGYENDRKGSIDTKSQLFITETKNGFSYRNVEVIVSTTIKWKRSSGEKDEPINEYIIPEWSALLHLCSPRVLLVVEEVYHKSTFKLKYILENPTPQSLNFTSELVDLKAWSIDPSFEDQSANELAPFTVKPVSSYIIQFYLKLHSDDDDKKKVVRLPKLNLFDINYRIYLQVSVTQNNVLYKDGSLYYVLS